MGRLGREAPRNSRATIIGAWATVVGARTTIPVASSTVAASAITTATTVAVATRLVRAGFISLLYRLTVRRSDGSSVARSGWSGSDGSSRCCAGVHIDARTEVRVVVPRGEFLRRVRTGFVLQRNIGLGRIT
jgi:hypothetical protein